MGTNPKYLLTGSPQSVNPQPRRTSPSQLALLIASGKINTRSCFAYNEAVCCFTLGQATLLGNGSGREQCLFLSTHTRKENFIARRLLDIFVKMGICKHIQNVLLHLSNSPTQSISKTRKSRTKPGTHYMKLQEITKSRSTVDADQDAIFHCGTEAHCKAVRACAGPVIGWPGVEDEATTFPKDVRSSSCKNKERGRHQGQSLQTASCSYTVETAQDSCQEEMCPWDSIWLLRGMAFNASENGCHLKLKMPAKGGNYKTGAREIRSQHLQLLLCR